MQQPDTSQIQLVQLTAQPVLMRIYLHPGMRDYFFSHASPEEIQAFIGPYEQDGHNLFASPVSITAPSTAGGRL